MSHELFARQAGSSTPLTVADVQRMVRTHFKMVPGALAAANTSNWGNLYQALLIQWEIDAPRLCLEIVRADAKEKFGEIQRKAALLLLTQKVMQQAVLWQSQRLF